MITTKLSMAYNISTAIQIWMKHELFWAA